MKTFISVIKELFTTKDGLVIILFLSSIIFIIYNVFIKVNNYRYDSSNNYYYECLSGVRYTTVDGKGSPSLMRDINDKPIPCN